MKQLKNKYLMLVIALVLAGALIIEMIALAASLGTENSDRKIPAAKTSLQAEQVAVDPDKKPEEKESEEEADQQQEEKEEEKEEEEEPEEQEEKKEEENRQLTSDIYTNEGDISEELNDEISNKEVPGGTGTEEGSGESSQPGDNGEKEPKPGEKGEGGSGEGEKDGPEDDSELGIVTDLRNREITFAELTDDEFPFYAYIVNGNDNMTLRVKYRNSDTPSNGKYLTGDGKNYTAKLKRQEANFFTLYIRENNKTLYEVNYTIRYVAQKANEENPEIGDHPPVITTLLDSGMQETTSQNLEFWVQARTYSGETIYASGIEVRLDGAIQKNPTGGPRYEYQLYLPAPVVGDEEEHIITVLAWDNEGNSSFRKYKLTYKFVDEGDEIGTAWIVLDASTVGLGILEEPYEYRIKQGEPASYAVKKMMEDLGYDCDFGGSLDSGFYLRRVYRGGLFDWAEVPEILWKTIQRDGITLTGQRDGNSLGEFDYTRGSGWMYSVNGAVYAGKGLSSYYLSNGDTLYLRFTLAYGKDIGGDGGEGRFSTYCGKWINGEEIVNHQWAENKVIKEATCTEDGEEAAECQICGEKQASRPIPALGHDFVEIERQPAGPGVDGYVRYQCTRCGETKEETLPAEPMPTPTPEEPVDPGEAGGSEGGETGDGGDPIDGGE